MAGIYTHMVAMNLLPRANPFFWMGAENKKTKANKIAENLKKSLKS